MSTDKYIQAIDPIRFSAVSCRAEHLVPISTKYHISKLLTQNILYCAYHGAKSISEIADVVGVPTSLAEKEIDLLCKNGFMERVSKHDVLTKIFISDLSVETSEDMHKIYMQYAQIVCERYVPQIVSAISDILTTKAVYVPANDQNFLLYTLVTLACSQKLRIAPDVANTLIKSIDGSEYFVNAVIDRDHPLSFDEKMYHHYGDEFVQTYRHIGKFPLATWKYDTFYDDRKNHWHKLFISDFLNLYHYLKGNIENCPEHTEIFQRLHHNGLLMSEHPNVVVTTLSKEELLNLLPAISDELLALNDQLGQQIYETAKSQYPPHIRPIFQALCKNALASSDVVVRVLGQCLSDGILHPLKECQRQTVNMIVFCDVMPQS